MDIPRKGALPHPDLALQQHRDLHLGGTVHQVDDVVHIFVVENQAGEIAILMVAGGLQLGGDLTVALLALLQLLLQGVKLGDVTDIGDHHDDIALGIKNGGAGDDGPFAGFELLLHRHRLPALQCQQRPGDRHDPAFHQLRHAAAHHFLFAQTADRFVAFIQRQGNGAAVGDIDAIIGRLENNLEPVALPPEKGVACPVFRHPQNAGLSLGHAFPPVCFSLSRGNCYRDPEPNFRISGAVGGVFCFPPRGNC